jgi:hypothetical protein
MAKNKEVGELLLRPSQYLMKNYSAAGVDEEGFDSSTSATTPSVDDDIDESRCRFYEPLFLHG